MMTIDYNRIPYYEKRDIGECAVRNAFYLRDIDEVEHSELHDGYHTHDYFGFSLADAIKDSAFNLN